MFGNDAAEQVEVQHPELWLRAKVIGRQRFIWRGPCVVKFAFALTFLIAGLPGAWAQQSNIGQTTLKARSNLVMVPVLVTTKRGQIVFGLKADDFHLTDDGVQQHVVLEQDTDAQPLALAIVVQTGGAGARHLDDYRGLDAILDTLIGEVDHRVAVIGFDSAPHVVVPFTLSTEQASQRLANLTEGGQGAAILDAVVFAVAQLREQPARYRRAILLLSETVDQGSKTNLSDALRLVSDTNTSIYSFAFSSTRSAVAHEASKLNGANPGPARGCFSREGADSEYEGHYDKQVLDCISQLAPPLRLATMSFLGARSALRTNTAESIAQLAGGEFFHFHDAKDLEAGLITASNHVPNYYVLSFRPVSPTPGLHALHVEARDHSQLVLKSRRDYWIDSDTPPED
jgi:VWFA-related protein